MAVSSVNAIGPCLERITIQQPTEATDTQGGRAVTWSTLATVWAEWVPSGAVERLYGNRALGSELSAAFRIRRRLDVTPSMRVSWTPTFPPDATARTFEIRGVVPMGDGRTWMHLTCTELS